MLLHEDRAQLGDLYITCHYYKRVQRKAKGTKRRSHNRGGPKTFAFNVANSDENHVTMVVCPVILEYDRTTGLYTLDSSCDDVIRAQLRGQTEWDPA